MSLSDARGARALSIPGVPDLGVVARRHMDLRERLEIRRAFALGDISTLTRYAKKEPTKRITLTLAEIVAGPKFRKKTWRD
jgi:hypothetical protein